MSLQQLKDWTDKVEEGLKKSGAEKVSIPTVFTAAPDVLEAFERTPYADRLRATGVITSYICPLMYMNNPLSEKMPVITSSNKLRTYTSARYYTDDEILEQITAPGNGGGKSVKKAASEPVKKILASEPAKRIIEGTARGIKEKMKDARSKSDPVFRKKGGW